MKQSSLRHGLTTAVVLLGIGLLLFVVLWQLRDFRFLTGAVIDPYTVGEHTFARVTGVSHGEDVSLDAGIHHIITCPATEPSGEMTWEHADTFTGVSGMKLYEYTQEYADEKNGLWNGLHRGFQGSPTLTTFAAGKTYYAYADEAWTFRCSVQEQAGSSSSSSPAANQPPAIAPLQQDIVALVGQQLSIDAEATDVDDDPIKFIVTRYDAGLDFDMNHQVDIGDLNMIGLALGAASGSVSYDPMLDLSGNGTIDQADISAFQVALLSQLLTGFGFDVDQGLLSGTPTSQQKGTYLLTFSAFTDTPTFPKPYTTASTTVLITDNQPPVLSSATELTVEAGSPLSFTLTADDPDTGTPSFFLSGYSTQLDIDGDGDVDIGDQNIIRSLVSQPFFPPADLNDNGTVTTADIGLFASLASDTFPGGDFAFNGVSGTITWTPQESDVGQHAFTTSAYNVISGQQYPYTSAPLVITVQPAGSSSSSASSSSSSSLPGGALSANLVGYWRFEEGAGSTVGDFSGNGNAASVLGTMTWSSDVPAAIPFSTTAGQIAPGSYLEVLHPQGATDFPLDFDVSDPFTVSLWFKGPASFTETTGIIGKLNSESLNVKGWQLQATPDNKFSIFLSSLLTDNTLAITANAFSPNVWHHLVFSYNGNTSVSGLARLKMYVDGIEQTLLVAPGGSNNLGSSMSHEGPLTMAGDQRGPNFPNGILDDVRIYNVVATPAEIE